VKGEEKTGKIHWKRMTRLCFQQGKNNEFHFLIASEDHEVQIYFYDGWKFHESPVDFTGDSFGAGVVNMRGYDGIINGTTTIGEGIDFSLVFL
jgi:hypothetical protein